MSTFFPLFDGAKGESWREKNPSLFRTDSSLRWFFRQHKARLIAEGAVILLADRWMACEPAMTTTVLAIARNNAEAAA